MQQSIKRIAVVLAITLAVAASLLTFPGGVPWMIGAWLLVFTALLLRGKPGWIVLATCAAVVVVKRGDWPWSLCLLAVITAATIFLRALPKARLYIDARGPLKIAVVAAIWLVWTVYVFEWRAATQTGTQTGDAHVLDRSRSVVCLGDSLTAAGYPDELQKLVSMPVVSLAREGATTEHALKQLPALVEANPQVVVIEIGGNDYVKGRSRAATQRNLQKMIDACRETGAVVVLVEIPRAFISDPYGGLEPALARKHDLQLISDTPIRRLVLWSPYAPPGLWLDESQHLSDDGLHPNAQGNKYLARRVATELAVIYGENVRAVGEERR